MSLGSALGPVLTTAEFPAIALLVLVGLQFNPRTRCSSFAFGLGLAGLLALAFMTTALATAAAAAA